MAITFVGATSSASGQNNNPPLPSGLQEGDLVLAGAGSDNTQASVPTGWTGLNKGANQSIAPDGNTDSRGLLCYKVMGPTPDTTFPINSGNQNFVCAAFRGVDVDNAGFINHTSAITTANGGMPDPPSVTPNDTSRNNWVVAWGMLDDDERTDVTAGANYTLIGSGALGGDGTTMAAYRANITAAEDPPQFGGGGTDEWDSYSVVLKPALANPTITDVDTDETIGVTQTNVVITGTIFQSPQGTGKVEISPNNTYAAGGLVQQTIDSWADTSIQFDVVRTGLSTGTNYIWVTNDGGNQNDTAFPITLTAETPSITNIDGDDALQVNQTNIVIAGDGFYPNQTDGPGTGFVELATTSAATGGTRVTQSIDTWADQSIQFDLTEGGLSFPGTYFARVYNGDNVSSAALSISVQQPVSITNVDGDDSLLVGQLGITITGTGFGTSQGTGKIEVSPNNTYGAGGLVEQTIDTWSSDTSISFDLVRTGLSVGTLYLYVTNDSGGRDQQTITLVAVNPTVSSFNGGTQIFGDTTGIAVVGLDFGAVDVGSAKVELGNASTYAGSGTKVEQTVTTWGGATSITVDAVRGGLSTGTVYVYVTNSDGGVNTNGLAVTLASTVPSIGSLDGDGGAENATITAGETVTTTGSNFRTTQTTGKVEVCNNISYASATVKNTQTITSWSNTSISFTVDNVTGLVEGTNYVFITNGTGEVS